MYILNTMGRLVHQLLDLVFSNFLIIRIGVFYNFISDIIL